MRFYYYKTLLTSNRVGYRLHKNPMLRGAITSKTFCGYQEKIAYCQSQNWKNLILGTYLLGILFLYGGHVHIINTKPEFTGVLSRFFQNLKKKEKIEIYTKKKTLFSGSIEGDAENILFKNILGTPQNFTKKPENSLEQTLEKLVAKEFDFPRKKKPSQPEKTKKKKKVSSPKKKKSCKISIKRFKGGGSQKKKTKIFKIKKLLTLKVKKRKKLLKTFFIARIKKKVQKFFHHQKDGFGVLSIKKERGDSKKKGVGSSEKIVFSPNNKKKLGEQKKKIDILSIQNRRKKKNFGPFYQGKDKKKRNQSEPHFLKSPVEKKKGSPLPSKKESRGDSRKIKEKTPLKQCMKLFKNYYTKEKTRLWKKAFLLKFSEALKKVFEWKKKGGFRRGLEWRIGDSVKKKMKATPHITFSDSSYLPGSLTNWGRFTKLPSQYYYLQGFYGKIFRTNRRVYEEYLRIKNKSIGYIAHIPYYQKNIHRYDKLKKQAPDIIILFNANRKYGIIHESSRRTIPLYGFVDTYTRPGLYDFCWEGSGTNVFSIREWCRWIFRMYRYVQIKRHCRKDWVWSPPCGREGGNLVQVKNNK